MTPLERLEQVFQEHAGDEALVWRDRAYRFGELAELADDVAEELERSGITPGSVAALEADFSPSGIAALIALLRRAAIVVPWAGTQPTVREKALRVAQAEWIVSCQDDGSVKCVETSQTADHDLYQKLRSQRHPGIVLFSSGSTGEPKATVHDAACLLDKFRKPFSAPRTAAFLLFDHIGGLDVLFFGLFGHGCLITVEDRSPGAVLRAVERHRGELLPASPTFLHLMLMGGYHEQYDLTSLKTIAYGTEPMPDTTLSQLSAALPHVRLVQTYGLSELGALRTQSRDSQSTWVKIKGEGVDWRVVDGMLQLKTPTAMLGYLNAPSPFTEDGWYMTGDRVEIEGDYLRILGRESEIINVGGEKVYPAEVENVLLQVEGVAEAVVSGEPNPITGKIVVARIRPSGLDFDAKELRQRIKRHCREHLEAFKIPVRITFDDEAQHGARFKKIRAASNNSNAEEADLPVEKSAPP